MQIGRIAKVDNNQINLVQLAAGFVDVVAIFAAAIFFLLYDEQKPRVKRNRIISVLTAGFLTTGLLCSLLILNHPVIRGPASTPAVTATTGLGTSKATSSPRPPATSIPGLTAIPSPPPSASQTHPETTGGVTHTWTNYSTAGGTQGQSIAAYQTVQIACKVTGFKVADGNTWWYRIALSPWSGQYYASADAFYNNGQTSGSLNDTPWVDSDVPNC